MGNKNSTMRHCDPLANGEAISLRVNQNNFFAKKAILYIIFLFITIYNIQAQGLGEWTWMKGPSTHSDPGTFGTKGVSSPLNNPPAIYEGYEWTDLNGNFWVFGGVDPSSDMYNCLWKFDPLTNEWTWVHGSNTAGDAGVYGTKGISAPTNVPGARGWGGVSWVDNVGDLWLFAGFGYDKTGAGGTLNDLWRYNIASNQWTWMAGTDNITAAAVVVGGTKGVPNSANTPDGRQETNAGVADGLGNLWLFGGLNPLSSAYNDVWKYNTTTNMWTWVAGDQTMTHSPVYGTLGVSAATNDPGDRFCYTKFIDGSNNMYFLGAGLTDFSGGKLVDVWKFNPTTTQWTWVGGTTTLDEPGTYTAKCDTISLNVPKAKYEVRASWPDSCGFFFFGGFDPTTPDSYNDLWYYNIENNKFTWLSGSSSMSDVGSYGTIGVSAPTNRPPSRGGALAFKDKASNLWLFGGAEYWSSGFNKINDLWRFKLDPACGKLCSKSVFNSALAANFYANTICGNAPLTVNFTNASISATTYTWNYGDGSALGYATNPSHTYTANGVYSVTLTAQGTGTNTATLVQTNYIYVGGMPTASFTTLANDSVCLNTPFTFTNFSNDSITNSNWSFGDGAVSTSSNTSHNYLVAGTYTVSLIVTDNHFCKDTVTQKVVVLPSPIASYINTPNAGCEPLVVSYNNTSTGATSHAWNFGDAQTSTITSPTHTYNTSGSYSVSLVVKNSFGCTDTAKSTIVVHPIPDASFTTTGYNGCFPYTSQGFANTLGLTNYQWFVNGVSVSTNDSLNLGTIESNTVKNITLITTNVFGCKDTVSVTKNYTDDNCNNLYIPNVFTPNGDGANGLFTVKATNYKQYHIIIYDRWGLKLFETTDFNSHWNGKPNNVGNDCPEGTYFYIINLVDKSDKATDYKGFLTLFR